MHSGGGGGARHHRPSVTSVSSIPSVSGFPSSPTTPTQTTATAASSTAGSQRKERGAIAAQACDTCRSRKQKCDEQRPKCGTCQKFKLDCHYREPQPTKKDKTLGEILDRLKSVENKIDRLGGGSGGADDVLQAATAGGSASAPGPASSTGSTFLPNYSYSSGVYQMLGWPVIQQLLAPVAARQPQLNVKALASEHTAQSVVVGLHHTDRLPSDVVSVVSGVPSVSGMSGQIPLPGMPPMQAPNVNQSRRDSNAGMMGGSHSHSHTPAPGFYPPTPVSLSLPLASFPAASPSMVSAPAPVSSVYSWDTLFRLSSAYFDSFNYIAPIVDRQTFLTSTLPGVLEEKNQGSHLLRDNDSESAAALVFLVAALGDVAMANAQGAPVLGSLNSLGVKGGTVSHPPGITLFNEARRRMGFVMGTCSLESVQIHALAGIYCSTCLRHMEYWRYTTAASLACQALITSKPAELSSPRADLIRQIFWYCLIVETHFNLELGLPLTGLDRFEDRVGLPSFSGPYSQDDYLANQASHFQEHFASQIVLRRLCVAFHASATSPNASSTFPAAIRQMASQLKGWRGMLPPHLRWQEARPADFPNTDSATDASLDMDPDIPVDLDLDLDLTASPDQVMFGNSSIHTSTSTVSGAPSSMMFPTTAGSTTSSSSTATTLAGSLSASTSSIPPPPSISSASTTTSSTAVPSATMFSTDLDAVPVAYPFALDLQVALLRSRYYYTKFLVYKPCLYKVLHAAHSEESVTEEDAAGAAACLQACLSWPVALSPTAAHKRLIPCIFFYTQQFLGTLLILRLAAQLPVLQRITATRCGGPRFAHTARETASLCIAWLRDLRGVDHAAAWAWALVQGLYHLED
ncbi:hypothetical protein SBRCBS47491_005921 [Sporothrix bragantina]|uniref:Zn(2)-C6 fungal-type domain-containing protein n=1 Tax=Sporothrix bragantina TaxID=671064 RepID=A0ABP0C116_9PEZI